MTEHTHIDVLSPLQLINYFKASILTLLLCIITTVSVAAVITQLLTPKFRAETRLIVVPNAELDDSRNVLRSLETLERRTVIATFAGIPEEPSLIDAALQILNVPSDREFVLDTRVLPNTNMIVIEVTDISAEFAAQLVDQLADQTVELAPSLYRIYSLRKISSASIPDEPSWPSWRNNLLAGGLLGLFIGLLLVFTRDYTKEKNPGIK